MRARSRLLTGLVTLGVVSALSLTGAAPATADPGGLSIPSKAWATGRYIVTLKSSPIATYRGGVSGLSATKPAKGRKVDVTTQAAKRYRSYLVDQQAKTAARVGAKPLQSYSVALNGFTAQLTGDQVARLQHTAGVLSVTKDRLVKATSDNDSTDFLKLSGSKGVWKKLGGASKAGRGIVVGVIDTGIWPESKSFAGPKLGTKAPTASDPYRPYRDGDAIVMDKADGSSFVGTCETGEEFTADDCSTKIVGARYFADGFAAGVANFDDFNFVSPRDIEGHGTHTASTAAGDYKVKATINGHSFGHINGVAPAAKIAVYKALWKGPTEDQDGGANSDLVAAIDQAVADGVDVINYSIGSSSESALVDPTQLAFLNAAAAGIFVSASAGNSGPGASTLDNTAPWMTTVAASSIAPRTGTVALGNGQKDLGVTTTVFGKIGPAPLVQAATVKLSTADSDEARLCSPDTLDPALVAGKIVVCDRGVVARVAKSAEVKRAGGIGVVLVNLTTNSLDADTHSLPTIIVNPPASLDIKAYAGTTGATATLTRGDQSPQTIRYPEIAGFSSRGPSLETGSDLLKPDIAAPGVAILAAVAPPGNEGRNFDFYSGTSMAAPHIAGLAALYLGKHPNWSPMAVKSAMMTTAGLTIDQAGKQVRDAYAQGAGNVRPWRMLDPGVVFDSGLTDWLAFLNAEGYETGFNLPPIDPSDLNGPSVAIGKLVGEQTVTRKVTALKKGTFKVTSSVKGYHVTVSPKTLKFSRAGQVKTLELTYTRTTAAFGRAAFGSVHLVGAGTVARLPVALTAAEVDAPDEIGIDGTSGSQDYQVKVGGDGTFTATARGLVAGTSRRGSVNATDGNPHRYDISIPAGTTVARFDLASDEVAADIDLAVYQLTPGGPELVGSSGSGTGVEQVTLFEPDAGNYAVLVFPFAEAPGTSESLYTLTNFAVPATSAGNLTVTPASTPVNAGDIVDLTASWSGLTAGTPYLGYIEYPSGDLTLVTGTA